MFYEYASSHADELEKLQLKLYEDTGIVWNDTLAEDSFNSQEEETTEADGEESTVDDESFDAENNSLEVSESSPDSPMPDLDDSSHYNDISE